MVAKRTTAASPAVEGAGKKRGRKPKPENETPAEAFRRLVNARGKVVIRGLRSLGKLSGAAYDYDTAHVKRLQEIIQAELEKAIHRLITRPPAQVADLGDLI